MHTHIICNMFIVCVVPNACYAHCHRGFARLHGNIESMAVLSVGGASDSSKRRDSIILAFRDAKISVLEYDDSTHSLRAR